MKIGAIGFAVFVASLFLTLVTNTLQSSIMVKAENDLLRRSITPQGGEPGSFVISATLYPDMPASLVYTNTDGTVAELYFPPQTTDITRTIYFITETNTYAPGMVFSGYAFGLIPFQDDVIDKQYQFLKPVSLTIKYPDTIIPPGFSETQIGLYHPTGDGWILAGDTCEPPIPFDHDVGRNLMAGSICEPAYYAVFGVYHNYLPIVAAQFP